MHAIEISDFEIILPIVTPLVHFLESLVFYNGFVSNLISLDIMIVGIVVPLGFSAVSGSLREYGEYGYNLYTSEWRVKLLIPAVLIHLALSIGYNALHLTPAQTDMGWLLVLVWSQTNSVHLI
jgi:hypothetical protein